MTRFKVLAVVSMLVLAGAVAFSAFSGRQASGEKTTTMGVLRSGNVLYIDISHRQYDIIDLEEHEEAYLRLLFNIEVRGSEGGFTLETAPSNTGSDGTELDMELETLPSSCAMGLQYVPIDDQGVAGEDTVQFAVVASLEGGIRDWTVKNPKVTVENLVLEFGEDLGNRSTPMVSMAVEADLLDENQYSNWMNSLNPPVHEIRIFDPSVRSIVAYDTGNKTDPEYGLLFNVWVDDADGLLDVANVSVRFPDGTVLPLQDEGTGLEYHPSGDGEYFNMINVPDPMTGNFTFEATDVDGNKARTDASLDEWLQPFDWVNPAADEAVNITEADLFFNTSRTELVDFKITLGNETTRYKGFWNVITNTTYIQYDGDVPLQNGTYWWTILAVNEKENIVQAYTEFEILK